jgi:hypothetical protein
LRESPNYRESPKSRKINLDNSIDFEFIKILIRLWFYIVKTWHEWIRTSVWEKLLSLKEKGCSSIEIFWFAVLVGVKLVLPWVFLCLWLLVNWRIRFHFESLELPHVHLLILLFFYKQIQHFLQFVIFLSVLCKLLFEIANSADWLVELNWKLMIQNLVLDQFFFLDTQNMLESLIFFSNHFNVFW